MKHTENFNKLCKCIDSEVNSWKRADLLTALEQRERTQQMIYGIALAGLYVLNGDEYHDLVQYIHDQGFNH